MTSPNLFLEPKWPGLNFSLFNGTLNAQRVSSNDFGHDQAMVWVLDLLLQPQDHGISAPFTLNVSLLCQRFFFATSSVPFLKSLQAIETLKKLQMIRATLPKNVDEVQANAHNLLSETQDSGVFPKLQIEPVMVQFPHDKNEQLGIVDYGSALGYIFSVHELPEELLHCSDAQVLMKCYYLPALALLTRMIWLLALPSQDLPRRPTLRYPKMACVIFHIAEEHSMEQRCLRGFFGSTVTDNSDIGKGAKKLSVAYRHNWTRKQIFKTHQASLPPVRPLMEINNVAALLNDMKRETAFVKLNKHSDNFERLLQALIKPPYLVPKDRLIALSSRRLAFQLRPDTQTFLNNLLRSQGLSDNPPTSDPLHESKLTENPIPPPVMEVCRKERLEDFLDLLCTWTEPVSCIRNDENRICSFSPSTSHRSTKQQERSPIYIKLETFVESRTTRAELETWILQKVKKLEECNESSAYGVDSDCIPRYGHCAETYAVNYFANFRLKKVGANGSSTLPLCGVSMRLESLKCSSKFTYEWITGTENSSDQQKTAILSDPCHNCKALLRLYKQTLTTFDLLFPLRCQFLKDQDGNLTRIDKEKGSGKFHYRDHSGEKIEVPTDSQGSPIKLKLGGKAIPITGEYMVYPAMLREYRPDWPLPETDPNPYPRRIDEPPICLPPNPIKSPSNEVRRKNTTGCDDDGLVPRLGDLDVKQKPC